LRAALELPDIPQTRLSALAGQFAALPYYVAPVGDPLLYQLQLSVVKMPTEGRFFGALSDALGLESSYWDRYAFYDAAGWTEGYATIGHIPTQTDINNGWRIVDILRESNLARHEREPVQLRVRTSSQPTQQNPENDLYDPASLIASHPGARLQRDRIPRAVLPPPYWTFGV
jgi:hypothetical protein